MGSGWGDHDYRPQFGFRRLQAWQCCMEALESSDTDAQQQICCSQRIVSPALWQGCEFGCHGGSELGMAAAEKWFSGFVGS